MSQPSGRGTDRTHRKDRNMAVTYSNNYSASGNQTLPSFRELLPQHVEEEIDGAAYHAPQSRSGRPHTPDVSHSKPRSSLPFPHPSPASTPGGAASYTSRGPSPILPPLRDLQSSSRHRHDRPMSSYDDASSRSGSGGRGYGRESSYASSRTSTTSMEDDPRYRSSAQHYGSTPPAAMYGNQNAYDPARYAAQQYAYSNSSNNSNNGDYDYTISPMAHSHTLPASSNFGVMGDPLDARGKRRRGNLPKPVTDVLRAWFHEHLDHPYPTEEDKQIFMARTGLSISQISNWFINARRRQLPALRNQLRNSDGEHIPRGGSPLSDGETSMSPPHSHSTTSPSRQRHR